MLILLLLLQILAEILRYLEICRILRFVTEKKAATPPEQPPKARGSFVVKRMEERLKEAMYPDREM